MSTSLPQNVKQSIEEMIDQLVAKDYTSVARTGRLTAQQVREAVDSYGKTLIKPPPNFWANAFIYPIDVLPDTWRVDIPLWTKEEGMADLILSLRASSNGGRPLVIEIDALRVQ